MVLFATLGPSANPYMVGPILHHGIAFEGVRSHTQREGSIAESRRAVATSSWDDGHPLDLRVADLLARCGVKGTCYVPVRNPERDLQHQADHDARDIAIGIVAFLARPNDVVWHGDRVFHTIFLTDICHEHFRCVLGDAVGVDRLRLLIFPKRDGASSMPGHAREVTAMINDSHADVIWVGLGTPKQERWINAVCESLNSKVLISVGAAFDFHTGRVKQAPPSTQQSGLEWLFRVFRKPRRLWRRYAYANPRFAWLAALQLAGLRKFEAGSE